MSSNTKEYNRDYKRKQRNSRLLPGMERKNMSHDELRLARNRRANRNNTRVRLLCLQNYSANIPFCACCGEKEIKFLSIDHINGGGNKHRKTITKNGKGGNISHWLVKNDFPDGFQVLCHNCNMAKGFYGQCPHKVDKY